MKPDGSYAHALLGRRLCGKWLLVRILGAGGTSTVFQSTHRNGKRAAIKVLHPELAANRLVRSRFKREAYVANRIHHPNVVEVLDDDVSEEGLVFLVMEYLEGETLGSRFLRTGSPLPAGEVVAAAIGVLEVLASAHGVGVVHRDVKPGNIFVMRGGAVKLLDFGIASLRELSAGLSELTATGATLGTPAFMAPEQARGRVDEVDATTDLWSLGATMFRLLTGRFVHEEKTAMEVVIATATRAAPSLGWVKRDLAAGLVAVVDRALAFEKASRWADAIVMRDSLLALDLHRPGQMFSGESFPVAQDQNTQDEAKDGWEPPSMLIQAGKRSSESPAAKRRGQLVFALATAATIAAATGAWLFEPTRRAAAPSPRSAEIGPDMDLRSDPLSGSLQTSPAGLEPERIPAISAARVAASSATSSMPAAGSVEPRRRPRVTPRQKATNGLAPAPSIEPPLGRTEVMASPPADPLDRR